MEKFYHGTTKLFNEFDLTHALEGNGKIKFGYGVYVTSSYNSAAHYAASDDKNHYVYTLEIPKLTSDNYIGFKIPVFNTLIDAAELLIGKSLNDKIKNDGKEFRKTLVDFFDKKNKINGEKLTSEWLLTQGIQYIIWPYNWKKGYEFETNRAVLNPKTINIIQIDEVELNEKNHFSKIINTL